MNAAFLILWIFVFLILALFIVVILRNIHQVEENKNIYIVNFNENLCYPNGDINQLPELQNLCCVDNGITTSKRRYFLESAQLSFLVDTSPVDYLSLCYDFCQNIDPKTGNCLDTLGDYPRCIQALMPPTGCLDYAIPLAQYEGVAYYAQQPYIPEVSGNVGNCPSLVQC